MKYCYVQIYFFSLCAIFLTFFTCGFLADQVLSRDVNADNVDKDGTS